MTRSIRLAARLYPARWRARYGDEFEVFLQDVKPGWPGVLNVVRGAIEMQMMEWRSARIVIFTGIAVAIAVSLVMAYAVPDTYISNSVMRFPGSNDEMERMQQKVLSRTSLADIVRKEDLYKRQRRSKPLEDVIEEMRRKDIGIRLIKANKANVVEVSFQYEDPAKAQRTNRDLVEALAGATTSNVEMLDNSSLPQDPVAPNRFVIASMGLGAGFIAGAAVALVAKRRRTKSAV